MITIQLSLGDVRLIAEALRYRAARHESYARRKPETAGPHDRTARAMRVLRDRILRKN